MTTYHGVDPILARLYQREEIKRIRQEMIKELHSPLRNCPRDDEIFVEEWPNIRYRLDRKVWLVAKSKMKEVRQPEGYWKEMETEVTYFSIEESLSWLKKVRATQERIEELWMKVKKDAGCWWDSGGWWEEMGDHHKSVYFKRNHYCRILQVDWETPNFHNGDYSSDYTLSFVQEHTLAILREMAKSESRRKEILERLYYIEKGGGHFSEFSRDFAK
jgi:hypothetical protein